MSTMKNLEVMHAPTRSNLGGAIQISTTVTDEQDTGYSDRAGTINFMTSVDDTYLLFDELSTMTDIVVADYAGNERCIGPFASGQIYSVEVSPRARYFTVITATNSGVFRWWHDR